MYIAPNTTIRLLRNVRLEPDYVNTIYFSSLSAQTSYFMGKTKYTLTAQSYQRVNKGVCRVNYKAEDLYDCNYMMFQNTSFGTKWFYAFITKIEYVNNVTADVYYEIDSIQSWLKDITFSMCFVEREHSGSDNIGDNIVPEPLGIGELVYNNYGKLTTDFDELGIVLLKVDIDNASQGNIIDGIYSGAFPLCFGSDQNGRDNINNYIDDNFRTKPDALLAMYLCPSFCMEFPDYDSFPNGYPIPLRTSAVSEEYSATPLSNNDTIDGHIVRNKKLFTYPYNFYHIDNANGRELTLRYEFFTDDDGNKNLTPQFKAHGNVTMPVTIVLRPMNYKGIKDDDYLRTESIDLTTYPMCSWNLDSWKAWLAQDAVPEALSIMRGVIGGDSISTSVGNGRYNAQTQKRSGGDLLGSFGAVPDLSPLQIFSAISEVVSTLYTASIKADICRGSLNNGNINVSSKNQTFFGGRVSVNNQQAKIIDDFFDRFGYATNELKVPNITSRRSWNYIKTIGSNVDGNIPGDDKRIIDACFDRGITFWHNGDNVDNYSLNNDPVAP